MIFQPKFDLFGKLEIIEIFDFYDKPLMLSLINPVDHIFLAKLGDESEKEENWVYISVSKRRLDQIKAGEITLQKAFLESEEGKAFFVNIPFDKNSDVTYFEVPSNSIPLDYLPPENDALQITPQRMPKLESSARVAQQLNQIVLKIRLKFENELRTEAPIQLLGKILVELQILLNSIAQALKEEATNSGPYPTSIIMNNELLFSRSGSGSFEMELVSSKLPNLLGETEVDVAVEKLVELISIGDNSEKLKEEIEILKPRVAASYYSLLDSISNDVCSAEFDYATPIKNKTGRAQITAQVARQAMAIIELDQKKPEEILSFVGELEGMRIGAKRFWITTQEMKYEGQIPEERIDAFKGIGVGRVYKFTLRKQEIKKLTTGKIEEKYELIGIENI